MFLPTALAVATLTVAQPASPPKFEIKDGDRIVWIGSTLVEREQRYGYWEAALHMAFPDKQFTLRNLGWSGDTVFGDARAGFDNQAKGFERLVSLTLELKPTVIFVSYGTNESFEGEEGLPRFEKGLEKLLDALKPANARVVLFTPLLFAQNPDLPNRGVRNDNVRAYARSILKIAQVRGLAVGDLLTELSWGVDGLTKDSMRPLMDNSMHLTQEGYEETAPAVHAALFVRPSPAREWKKFDWKKLEILRQAIVTKNQLFFYRWRPQNETYLFGFRKHEQGKNGKEVAEFDPLVAKAEEEIETIRKDLKPK
ncbi:MAG: GDSL-like Lipase/Acylhydrolase [Gemmataceae bacterium]|nr:GDSL-like Lipase/Acylhydrolase [Gemmataceae bacterium]